RPTCWSILRRTSGVPFAPAGAVRGKCAVLLLVVGLAALSPAADAQELMGTRIVSPDDLRVVESPEGTIRTYFDAPTSTLINLGLRVTVLDPGETPHPIRPHSRATESMLLVHEGSLQVRLDDATDATEILSPGTVLLLGPNQWH